MCQAYFRIKIKGISDNKVLDAISKIPRHLLFEPVFRDKFAYQDMAFPIGANQTISQPYTVAFQSELLMVNRASKILEMVLDLDIKQQFYVN